MVRYVCRIENIVGKGENAGFTSLKHSDKEGKLQNFSSLKLEGAEL